MTNRRKIRSSVKLLLATTTALGFATASQAQNNALLPLNTPTSNQNTPVGEVSNTATSASIIAEPSVAQVSSLQERTTIQYRDASLIDVIRHLCEESKINHVISPRAMETASSKTVTLKLIDVTYEVVLKTILDSYHLGTVLENGIVRIDSIENIKTEQEDRRKIRDARIKEEPTRVAIYQLNYMKSDQISGLVMAAMKNHSTVDPRFSVQADTNANRLIVEGVQNAQVRVKSLIETLDRRKQQVVIEARIIEASNSLRRGVGINWGTRFGLDAGRGLASGLVFPNSIFGSLGGAGETIPDFGAGRAAPAPGQMSFSIGTINGMFNIDGILKAYEAEAQVNIIAQPTLTVMDNEKGEFTETINKKFVIPPPATSTTSTATVSDFTMRLSVAVTPLIAADGSIELNVDVARDSMDPGAAASATYQGKISRQAKTRLAVKHGETAVIGGLYTTTKLKSTGRIPFLGSLPIVGFFFRDSSTTTDRTELMILLTPRVINNATGGGVATTSDFSPTISTSPLSSTPVFGQPSTTNNTLGMGLNNNGGGSGNLAINNSEDLNTLNSPANNTGLNAPVNTPKSNTGLNAPVNTPMNNTGLNAPVNTPMNNTGLNAPVNTPMSNTSLNVPANAPVNSMGGGNTFNNLDSLE